MRETVSVVVATRNRVGEVVRLLKSVDRQTVTPDEIVIVDSSDLPLAESSEFSTALNSVMTLRDRIKVLRSVPGLTRQRNLGVQTSTGSLVFFFDDDVVLDDDYIELMRSFVQEHPQFYGGMGNLVRLGFANPTRIIGLLFRQLFLLQRDLGSGRFRSSGMPQHPIGRSRTMETEVLTGAAMMLRRGVFDQDDFDESLEGYCYMEDADFSWRVSRRHKLFYFPRARVDHVHAQSGRPDSHRMGSMQFRNQRYLFLKNFAGTDRGNSLAFWWASFGTLVLHVLACRPRIAAGYLQSIVRELGGGSP